MVAELPELGRPQPTWKELLDGMDFAESVDLKTYLPTAGFAEKIPQGLPTSFIDKFAQRSAFGEEKNVTFGVEETGAPLYEWVSFPSTWLSMARFENTDFEATKGSLFVEFLSLAMVRYDDVPSSMWDEMIKSRSKGQFLYFVIAKLDQGPGKGWPYDLLRWPMRKVTQAMRDAHYERTAAHGSDYHLHLPA